MGKGKNGGRKVGKNHVRNFPFHTKFVNQVEVEVEVEMKVEAEVMCKEVKLQPKWQ